MKLPGVFDMPTITNGPRSNEDLRKSYRLTGDPPRKVRAEYYIASVPDGAKGSAESRNQTDGSS